MTIISTPLLIVLVVLAIVLPTTTGLSGYLLASRNEDARDRRQAAREQQLRDATRAERLDDERKSFQRDTLLELQDVLQREVRLSTQRMAHDRQSIESSDRPVQLPTGLSDAAMSTGMAIHRLRIRILDDDVRDEVRAFREFTAQLQSSITLINSMQRDEALAMMDDQLIELASRYQALTELLGIHIREEMIRAIES